jgi:predicted nucleic acid-binding Zn ribbon protein
MGCPSIVHCRYCGEPLDIYQPAETRFCSNECEADAAAEAAVERAFEDRIGQ